MKLFLASTSPRRRELMSGVGFKFEIIAPHTAELEKKGESPRAMVKRFALEKADAAVLKLKKNTTGLVIAADTTVVSPDRRRVLNKPSSTQDAKKILKTISGKTHTVLTGYAVYEIVSGKIKRKHYAVVSTLVKMRKLTPNAISNYVASGEPMDKAGAYGAQGIGMCLIESIKGSYSNVVGLPMAELVLDLERKFNTSPKWKR
jgi:septum formation protein